MAMVRLSMTGWRRRDARAEDDGGNFPIHGELSVGATGCPLLFRLNMRGCPLLFRLNRPCYWTAPNVRMRQSAWAQLLRWMAADGYDGVIAGSSCGDRL